jgi:adenine C2-methylase RlmN of 23S rRNA A2503 and tRNA A37
VRSCSLLNPNIDFVAERPEINRLGKERLGTALRYNARNDEIRDNLTRMQRKWEAQRGALATVRWSALADRTAPEIVAADRLSAALS